MAELQANDSALITSLCKDSLINNTGRVHIRYNNSDCWVNGTQLNNKMKTRYIKMSQNATGKIAANKDEYFGLSYSKKDIQLYCKPKSDQ